MNEKPHPDAVQKTCIKCGASVIPGDQYCDSCGAKIETSPSCEKCGAQLEPDAQFCDSCGAKIETTLSCEKCGAQLEPDAQFCDTCGAQIGEGKMAVQSEPLNQKQMPTMLPTTIQQEPPVTPSAQKKSPGLALIASFFIPGLGQIYNGKTAKGFAIFFGALIGSFLFLIPGLIVWIYGMFDAHSTAKKMNNGEIPFVPYKKIYIIILIIIWLVILAITLLILYYTFMIFLPAYTATTNAGNWNDKGDTFYQQGNFQEALDAYNKALSINPNDESAWVNKGVTLSRLGEYQEAVDACDKALSINPNLKKAWDFKGLALTHLGEYQDALDALNKALSIDPNYKEAWVNKGGTLYLLGEYQESLDANNNALSIDPNYEIAWNNKGNALEKLGRRQEAQDAYNKASLIHSKNLVSTTPTTSQQSSGQPAKTTSSSVKDLIGTTWKTPKLVKYILRDKGEISFSSDLELTWRIGFPYGSQDSYPDNVVVIQENADYSNCLRYFTATEYFEEDCSPLNGFTNDYIGRIRGSTLTVTSGGVIESPNDRLIGEFTFTTNSIKGKYEDNSLELIKGNYPFVMRNGPAIS